VNSVGRRLSAAALAVATALIAGGCSSSFNTQTNQQYQPAVGANHRGEMSVLNGLLVANEDGSATVSASLVNNTGSDTSLSAVTVKGSDGSELPVRSIKILLPVPNGELTRLGGSSDAGGWAVVSGADAGQFVTMTISFTTGQPVTLKVPVVARSEMYESVVGGESPTSPPPTSATATSAP